MSEITDHLDQAKRLYKPESVETVKHSNDTAEARRWRIMVALWERMGQFFGSAWEKNFGTVEDQTIHAWNGALGRFSEDEIAHAVKAVARDFKGAFPPTFPEFRELCETAKQYSKSREAQQESIANAVALEDLSRTRHEDSAATRAEKRRMANLDFGPTKRDSYNHLELYKRWGPAPEHWD